MSTAHDLAAEQAVLGACIAGYDREAFRDAASVLTRSDFWRPAHELIWQALEALHTSGAAVDPIVVDRVLRKLGVAEKTGGAVYLAELVQRAPVHGLVPQHARTVADLAIVRRVAVAGQRIAQHAETVGIDPAELVQFAGEQLAAARDERKGVDVLTSGWDEFIHSTAAEREMVIPGLLGVGDRLVLTGHGGLGKSTMLQQIAVTAAAGLPPFDYFADDPFDPVKVTILDFENPDHRVKTRLWPMVQDCVKMGTDPRPNLTVGGGGNPLNLLNAQNALSLLRTIEHDKPRLVYIGPVYKMHNDDPDKESVIKKITDVLDSIRAMGIAIVTEAHHTKEGRKGGTLEPSGSNLWTWWPEFGLGLRLVDGENNLTRRCYLERWRIDREASQWPDEVEASGQIGLAWARASFRGMRGAA